MKFIYSCFVVVCVCTNLFAQNLSNTIAIDEYIADIFEQYTSETEEELNFESFYEELMSLYNQPLNLNNTNREELEKMMFLSDLQVENILYYTYKFGAFRTIYELQLIEGLDMTDIRYMLPFVSVGDSNEELRPIRIDQVFKYGKNELLSSFNQVVERKAGYSGLDKDSANYYGGSLSHHLKYRFHYKDRVLLSFTAEKDAGEQFLGKKNVGYDFYSASIQVKNIGCVRNIILGDFQAGFGQGLVFRQAFGTGKSSMTTRILSNSNGFKRYGSTNEFNYFRGSAVSLQYKKLNAHFFYSNKAIDGSVDGRTFSGFYTTGYHRTIDELKKKNSVQEVLYGGNLTLTGRSFQFGVTSVFLKFNHDLVLGGYPYQLFYFQGDRQFVTGVNYRYKWKKFNFFGETAFTNNVPATINGCTYSPVPRVNIALTHRYYSPQYNAVFATAFSEGSKVTNERGFYLGIETTPVKYWRLSAYADCYHFPWVKYGIDAPVVGKDFFLQTNFTPSRKIEMFWRIKYEQNAKNKSGSVQVTPQIQAYCKSSLRYQLVYNSGNFTFKNIIEGNMVRKGADSSTYGIAALQDVSFSFQNIPMSIDVRYLFFDATDYENRIYAYEKDVLYAFSSPMFSGTGSRYYINLRYDLWKNLSCWLKFSQILYADDRESFGSGRELIVGNRKAEIKCLIRWKFDNN
jgi:hypothetical protein